MIFTLADLKRLRAGAILAVDSKPLMGVGKGEFEPGEKTGEMGERVQEAIKEEIRIAIKAVEVLENQSKKEVEQKRMQERGNNKRESRGFYGLFD